MTSTQPSTRTSFRPNRLALDAQLCFALYATSMAMTKRYKPLLAPLGLTYPQYLAMLVLWEGDGIAVSQLGERLQLDSGTLTPLLKRLETAGMLRRERDAGDERRVLLKLTPVCRALRARAASVPTAIGKAVGCDLDELSVLTSRLHQLRNEIDVSSPRAA